MKQIKVCLVCQKPVAKSLAYQGELETIITNPLTGRRETQVMAGYLCAPCNQACGYKTIKSKLEKYGKSMGPEV